MAHQQGREQSMSDQPTLEQLLRDARAAIEVSDEELVEARTRRSAIIKCLESEFAGSRSYVNGSVAHGDALSPLSDVDLGVVVPDPDRQYGPAGDGPGALIERAAQAIREGLKEQYEDLQVEYKNRRRSILVRFRDPVTPGAQDFTADVIVAVDYPQGDGLYIPKDDSWDRSHPEEHTRLVLRAIKDTDSVFARVVRLVKHWNKHHKEPLCSWNIKALALGCLSGPMTELEGLAAWYEYAAAELVDRETPDPTGVAPGPIKTNLDKDEVVKRLKRACTHLQSAIAHEKDGHPVQAHEELSKWLGDPETLPPPLAEDVYAEIAADKRARQNLGVGRAAPFVPTKSWRLES